MAREAHVVLQTVEGPELRFLAKVDDGPELVLDGSADPQGPNPVAAVLAAVAGCTGMDVISILRKKRQVVLGYEVVARGERRPEHPKSFTRIEVVHRLRGRNLNPAAIEEAIRLSETKYCSVHAMLSASAEITSRFEIIPA
ncbi:MAG TPA: OsmC family protein [Candidatus Limnocylindria bacterium]|nr:OsmC family protein [Candidatus Limnocylindria bacterium]